MFETNFNIHLCYVIYCKDMVIKSHYLKPIFKNRKSSVGI